MRQRIQLPIECSAGGPDYAALGLDREGETEYRVATLFVDHVTLIYPGFKGTLIEVISGDTYTTWLKYEDVIKLLE